MPIPAPRQIRTRRFPPSGSSVDVARRDVPLPPEVMVTCAPMSAHWAWVPPEDHTNTGRLCSAGSGGASRSPTSPLVCSPPTPCLLWPRLRFPLPVAYLAAGASSVPLRPTTRALANVSCVGDGSPALRATGVSSRRGEGLPGYGAVLFVRAMVEHPAGYHPLLAQKNSRRGWLLPAGKTGPSASGKVIGFGAACPMAHMLACLRFADLVSKTSARLATGSGGLTLGRAGFAPAGRQTKFHEGIASSNPN